MTHHHSRNSLSPTVRQVSANVLNACLADTIDLALLTKQAHWNVRGPQFIALHEMFDGFREDLDIHVDALAERVVQLGGTALGTSQSVVKTTSLAPYPTDIHAGPAHLSALLDRYAALSKSAREAIEQTGNAGDAASADLLTDYLRSLDKSVWLIDAHLHSED